MVYLLDNEVPCAAGKGMWGDYAHVLWAGFASQDESGVGYVERTGPFVPDAYLASNSLICTERVKDNIVSNTPGLLFVPQEKKSSGLNGGHGILLEIFFIISIAVI